MPDIDLISKIKHAPETVEFNEVIAYINDNYHYTPVTFHNGTGTEIVTSAAGTNEGSCKIFAFAELNHLDQLQTLHCFGHFYREDVHKHPDANDHANIRQFMRTGWKGIRFDQQPLKAK